MDPVPRQSTPPVSVTRPPWLTESAGRRENRRRCVREWSESVCEHSGSELSATNAVTITLWVNRTWAASAAHNLFESTANYNNSTTGFALFPDDPTCKGIQAALQGDAGYTANCYKAPSSAVWHHLAAVFDKSQKGAAEVALYMDGVLQTATQNLIASNNTNAFGNNPIYSVLPRRNTKI